MQKEKEQMVLLGQKRVFLSQPYNFRQWSMIGREHELTMILSSWIENPQQNILSPILLGDAGCGKNRLVYESARIRQQNLYIIQGHNELSTEDLVCSIRYSDSVERKMDYMLSPLATALYCGGICFFDEIAKVPPRSLALLASVLDERRYLDSTVLGERIVAHPDFRFVAATNTSDLSVNYLPDYMQSRLRPVIKVPNMHKSDIDRIVATRFSDDQLIVKKRQKDFWKLWQRNNEAQNPSPRDALFIYSLASNLSLWEKKGLRRSPKTELSVKHLEKAFELFSNSLNGYS